MENTTGGHLIVVWLDEHEAAINELAPGWNMVDCAGDAWMQQHYLEQNLSLEDWEALCEGMATEHALELLCDVGLEISDVAVRYSRENRRYEVEVVEQTSVEQERSVHKLEEALNNTSFGAEEMLEKIVEFNNRLSAGETPALVKPAIRHHISIHCESPLHGDEYEALEEDLHHYFGRELPDMLKGLYPFLRDECDTTRNLGLP